VPKTPSRGGGVDPFRKHLHQVGAFIGEGVVLPTDQPEHQVTGGVAIAVGAQDLGHARAAHHLVDRDWGQIALRVVHPGPDGGVDRQVAVAQNGLSRTRLGDIGLLEADGLLLHVARRAFR
jgi:hypothetical protein